MVGEVSFSCSSTQCVGRELVTKPSFSVSFIIKQGRTSLFGATLKVEQKMEFLMGGWGERGRGRGKGHLHIEI